MPKQFEFDIKDSLKKLNKSLKDLPVKLKVQIDEAVQDVAKAAYATIVAKVQSKLHSTRQDYLKDLSFIELGPGDFLIYLEGKKATGLEEGWPAFDLKPHMLASNKIVQVGSRSGQPWVQNTKPQKPGEASHKYAFVPLQKHPQGADMATALQIQGMTAKNSEGLDQKLTKIFRDSAGNPLEGKVATGRSDNPLLDKLVKYQKNYTNETGKVTTQSVYINYRVVSEAGKSWMNPGFGGIHAFEDAEKQVAEQIQKILNSLT